MNKLIVALVVFIGLTILIISFGPIAYVPVGHRGVVTRFGAITGHARGEGVHLKIPLVEGNRNIEVRVQKVEGSASAASKDLQSVSSKIAVNYAIAPDKVVYLYQSVGTQYDSRLIEPAIQESVKAGTARFTAEELITKRGEVSDEILNDLKSRLEMYGIQIIDLNIVDFDFSDSFNESIERKVTAQQDALAAENRLKQIQFEAEQAVVTARGKAEALETEGSALRANPEVVTLRAIEQWNGILPTFMGSDQVPFIQIK